MMTLVEARDEAYEILGLVPPVSIRTITPEIVALVKAIRRDSDLTRKERAIKEYVTLAYEEGYLWAI